MFTTAKLLKHLDRLSEWREHGDTRPIMVGLDLTNVCNHRCPLCNGAPGFLDGNRATLPFDLIERLAMDMKTMGVKAVSLGGGGDATCHPRLADVLRLFKAKGIETALFTNAQLMRDDVLEAVIACCTWVRISLDADGPEMFAKTHGMTERDFAKVIGNLRVLVRRRREAGSSIVIGTSFLIGSHTKGGILGATRLARDLGVDYIRMRPFFTWNGRLPFSQDEASEIRVELAKAATLSTPAFQVSYPGARTDWVVDGPPPRNYVRCNVHRFTTQISADAKVYLCCHTKDMPRYCLGDLSNQSLLEIWASERRRQVYENIDYGDCATPCMMSAHNDLLHLIDAPTMHENFL